MATLSNSYDLGDIEGFIRGMREFGATRIQVGGISVDFGGMPPSVIPDPPAVELTPEETKKQLELAMYGSSD